MSGVVHAWKVFRKTRIVAFSEFAKFAVHAHADNLVGLALLLDLFLALLVVVTLVGGWAAYDAPQSEYIGFVSFPALISCL